MTVTLLSAAPDLSEQVVRYTQKDTGLLVLPPLAGVNEPIRGDLYVCERYVYKFASCCGALLILCSQVYFYSTSANSGIAVDYPDIIIHAISRQEGRPCIYCQLEVGRFFPNQQLPEDEDEQDIVTELKFMPEDTGACKESIAFDHDGLGY